MQTMGESNIKIFHKNINRCKLIVFTFTIDENVIYDVIINSEQEFSIKRDVGHARGHG